ncbi:hypothetical protein ABT56_00985 [Photobacterium aquae]|uniref:Transporter n=1 Tax=Photobacterium aquae TaxID=1195763 RepID=A0A0J1K348_9GAMM|nr:YeeE/YedE family protein [Photobacterium aquae]KLV08832.1 hypothetical protein ABT56_00985 [Photobacterium aquae]
MSFRVMMVSLVSGLLFGFGMMLSGMVDPAKVIGFLDISGQWDPRLAFVMGGALLVFAPGYWLLVRRRQQPVLGGAFNLPTSTILDKKLLLGATMFGVGWGMAGICPGPAVTSISGLNPAMIIFLAALLLGMKIAPLGERLMVKQTT